jgi:hypothetical protein
LQVSGADKSVSINTLALVDPHANEVVRLLDGFNFGSQETLENVSQMTNIELVVEVCCSFTELHCNLVVELQGLLNNGSNLFTDGSLELYVML